MSLPSPIRIATRSSALALWQAGEVRRRLLALDTALDIALIPIHSDGDIEQTQGFEQFGYKGVFTKRIEAALLDGRADIAVHSMKDLHSDLSASLCIAAALPREDARDAFVSPHHASLLALPEGASLGTASVRRQAIIRHLRPDLRLVPFRGNVPTRLDKLARGEVDASLLAVAGLKRLGLEAHIREILPPETMLPAVAQGIIGIEAHRDDAPLLALLSRLSHPETMTALRAERAMLRVVDGDCHTPLSGHARQEGGVLHLQARWYETHGPGFHSVSLSGNINEPERLGEEAGRQLKTSIGSMNTP